MTLTRKARKPATDKHVEAVVMNQYRELGHGVSINMLDIPEIYRNAYNAGLGAKYTTADPGARMDAITAAVRETLAADLARLRRN